MVAKCPLCSYHLYDHDKIQGLICQVIFTVFTGSESVFFISIAQFLFYIYIALLFFRTKCLSFFCQYWQSVFIQWFFQLQNRKLKRIPCLNCPNNCKYTQNAGLKHPVPDEHPCHEQPGSGLYGSTSDLLCFLRPLKYAHAYP